MDSGPAAPAAKKPRQRGSSSGQTAKKRELDRIAQKKSREKARNRMAELEDKIRRLQAGDKQKQISELMGIVEHLTSENEKLMSMTEKIRSLTEVAGPNLKTIERPPLASCRRRSSSGSESDTEQNTSPDTRNNFQEQWGWGNEESSNDSPVGLMIESNPVPSATSYPSQPVMDLYAPPVSETNPNFGFVPYAGLTAFGVGITCGTPAQLRLQEINTSVQDHDIWAATDDAFVFGINKTKKMNMTETRIINSHSMYESILWNYDMKDEEERNHPLWLALKRVDETVGRFWEKKSHRIAMMFLCQRVLLYKSNPSPENLARVPKFLRPRPSQEHVQHPAIVDFILWPGLRDRLVFSHKRYASTADFSTAFCGYMHFNWPFPDDQILLFDHNTQAFRISPLLEQYAFEMKNWTLEKGFFEKYMEMEYDILRSSSEFDSSRTWMSSFDYTPMNA